MSSPSPHPSSYFRAGSTDEAVRLMAEPGAVALGGGTDLLVTIAEDIARPELVVDVRATPDGTGGKVHALPDGGVRIDASASLTTVARDPLIHDRFPALAQACRAVATPALRNMGTLGGNLCQRPRCWYFRRGVACLKRGGTSCPAVDGENQYLAILDGGPCFAVHPSDPAVALTALEATVEIVSMNGVRQLSISEFYTLPTMHADRETVLGPGELVTAV